ncbi:MAG: hypothetical protein FJ288_18530, partial [Planctomycetes bacterium]|nr:hypothetical protein [Planctomycetota bacterium]
MRIARCMSAAALAALAAGIFFPALAGNPAAGAAKTVPAAALAAGAGTGAAEGDGATAGQAGRAASREKTPDAYAAAGPALAAIEKVEIKDRALSVNGKPFFPVMIWLQDAQNFPLVKSCGMNTVAGYWPRSSGTRDVAEYMAMVWQAGLYGVMPFDERLKGHPGLLGYIHDDEPDLPRDVSDAEVVPGGGLRVNRSTPLWRIVDGVWHSWSVLDPLQGAEVTIKLKAPVTVTRLAVYVTVSKGLAVAKDVAFEGDGKEILRAAVEAKKERQALDLPQAATFKTLTMKVLSVHPGEQEWG